MAKVRTHNDGTNLIVNYLPQTVDEEELSTMFSECGMIEDVRLMRDGKTQISRGFAFVKYVDKEAADRAIKTFTGYKMGRKILRVSLSRPAGEETRDANLLIENLPRRMLEDELVETFSVYGTLITHRVLMDNTGKSKGKAYVRFNTKGEAEDAIIGMNGINLGGDEPLVVKFAEPATVNPTPELLNLKSARTSAQPYPLHGRPAPHRDPYSRPPTGPDRDPYSQRPGLGPVRDPYGQRPSGVRPDSDPYAQRPGMDPYSPSDQSDYPPVNGARGRGLPRRLSEEQRPVTDFRQTNHPNARPPMAARQPPREPPRPMPTIRKAEGQNSRIPDRHHSSYDAEKGWCVFVYNIPAHATDETLYRLFSRFGAINTVKPVVDENDNCKGYGFVHMMNYEDAWAAIQALNGEEFEGKNLQIRFKNDKK